MGSRILSSPPPSNGKPIRPKITSFISHIPVALGFMALVVMGGLAAPTRPLESPMRFTSRGLFSHRIRVRGVVTLQRPETAKAADFPGVAYP